MGVYGGIQLPNINEENLDNKKERKQILNYLALLDEKLRYMFQNIDIEENLSADAQERFFQYGKDITNLIKDTEGNFSAFKQSIDGITLQVQDLEGNHALLQQTADGLISAVGSVEGSVSLLQQEAARIETEVQNLDGEVSTLTQTADGLSSTVKKLQDDVTKNASAITQTAEEIRSEVTASAGELDKKIADGLTKAYEDIGKEIDSDVGEAYGELKVLIGEANSKVTQTAEEIRAEVNSTTLTLTQKVETDVAAAKTELGTRIENDIGAAKAEIDGKIGSVEDDVVAVNEAYVVLEKRVTENASSISQTAEQIRSEVNATSQILTQKVETDVGTAKTELGAKIEADIGAATTATNKKIDDDIAAAKSALEEKIAVNSSSITQTATEIRSEVSQQVTSLNNSIDSLDDDIYDLTGEVDSVRSVAEQAADRFSWIVESGTSASRMTLTDEFLEIVADNIEIKADVDLYGEMTVYKTSSLSGVGGHFGYMYGNDPLNGSTRGIGMVDGSKSGGVICHGSASAIWYDSYGITIDSSDINFVGDYNFYLATNFYCGTDGKSALGKSTRTWAMLYADACSCCTSDERRKNSIGYDLTAYEGLFERLKPTQFKMNNGTSERFHIGFISQDVESAMEEIGMDSKGFAGFIKSPVYEEDEKGKEIEGGDIVDYRYGLRYEEFIALNTHMIQKLMARVAELENKLEALS